MKKIPCKTITHIILFLVFSVFSLYASLAQNQPANIPSYLNGTVTDCYNSDSLNNVIVTAMAADTFTTETNASGYYKLLVDADTFDVIFAKPGMLPDTVFDRIVPQGIKTEQNMALCEIPYPPAWVFLDPNEQDTEALVIWTWPCPDYEIIYDDGNAEDYAMWVQAGGKSAVRFTPAGYPATVKGGRIYVGDGSFPIGADFIGTDFAIGILDDDGPDGMPGTVLDSIVVTVNNYEWVSFDNLFNHTFLEGDFYLVMWQLGIPPNAAPIGIDTDIPTVYRSYVAMAETDWIVSPYQDFMMRATVGSPNDNLNMSLRPAKFIVPVQPPLKVYIATSEPKGIAGRVKNGTFKPIQNKSDKGMVEGYDLAWIDNFDPNNNEEPADGTLHLFPGNELSPYIDTAWGARPPGFYAYAVKTYYENDTSVWTYSNIAAHKLDNECEVNIELCDDSLPENIEVLLIGQQYPFQKLEGIANVIPDENTANILFDSVINGIYDLTVFKVGYEGYFHFDLEIFDDYTEFVNLQEKTFPPTNLFVDSITSIATWDPALITALPLEDFEGDKFPPEGWQKRKGTGERGWYRDDDTYGFPVPPGDGFYALANSYLIGSGPYETDNYLITPMVDLRQSPDYKLYLDHFFKRAYGETAKIKYSTDSGATWETYHTFDRTDHKWEQAEISLSPLSGPEGFDKVWLALYYSDNRNWAMGWAIDNISITNGPAPVLGYYVYLDDSLVAETPPDVSTYTYNDLIYGLQYKASVEAIYDCGPSDPIHYTWGSGFLYAPRNLGNNYIINTDEIPLYWLPPSKTMNSTIVPRVLEVPDGLLGFKVYQNGEWIADVLYNGEDISDTIHYIVSPLDPACYSFDVSAVYDLGIFGFPGEEGETIRISTDTICVVWGYGIPFFEDWNEGGFAFNGWRLDGNAWSVNSDEGFPEPAAEFNSDMLIGTTDYSSTLTSNPFLGNLLSEGDIFLDFNVKLDNINATANEKMLIEISTDAGKTWDSIAGYSNADGSFDYAEGFRHINITEYAMGQIFHIRFKATGNNATDIQSWFVDNIQIYRVCTSPTELEGTYFWNANDWGVEVQWRVPEILDSAVQWLFWDNENYTGGFGFSSNTYWSVAQRWDSGQLKDWNGVDLSGFKITKISIILNDDNFSSIYLRIWSGENAGLSLYHQKVEDPVIGEWMEVQLDEAVAFDIDSALWIGYTINGQSTGALPAAYDEGPAVSGYGDMFYVQEKWWKSSQLGLDNNWAIHAYLEKLPAISNIGRVENLELKEPMSVVKNRDFTVFNLYRQEIGIDNDYVLYDIIPLTEGQLTYSYFDFAPAVSDGKTYNYQVSANYASDIDACESAPALSIPMTEDYVSILVTNIEESEPSAINLYPNPAGNQLNISSDRAMKQIILFNYTGQIILNREVGGIKTEAINTSVYESGVYVIKVVTEAGTVFKRLVITE